MLGKLYESESEVAQSCPTLCDPMDCSLSGSSVHGIFQARVLEWIAISFSRGSSQVRDRTQVSSIAGVFFTTRVTREAQSKFQLMIKIFKVLINIAQLLPESCTNLSSRQQECLRVPIRNIFAFGKFFFHL